MDLRVGVWRLAEIWGAGLSRGQFLILLARGGGVKTLPAEMICWS